jgi:hypothetical protein
MLILNTTSWPQIYSPAPETGKAVSMRQALAYLAHKRPQAVVLRKRRAP